MNKKPPTTVREKTKMVQDRYGKTTGASKGAAKPTTKVKPKGTNPLRGRYGVEIKRTW